MGISFNGRILDACSAEYRERRERRFKCFIELLNLRSEGAQSGRQCHDTKNVAIAVVTTGASPLSRVASGRMCSPNVDQSTAIAAVNPMNVKNGLVAAGSEEVTPVPIA
jgi:hypothetical protein